MKLCTLLLFPTVVKIVVKRTTVPHGNKIILYQIIVFVMAQSLDHYEPTSISRPAEVCQQSKKLVSASVVEDADVLYSTLPA